MHVIPRVERFESLIYMFSSSLDHHWGICAVLPISTGTGALTNTASRTVREPKRRPAMLRPRLRCRTEFKTDHKRRRSSLDHEAILKAATIHFPEVCTVQTMSTKNRNAPVLPS